MSQETLGRRTCANFPEERGESTGTTDYLGRQGVRVSVAGCGWITARSRLAVDFGDPLTPRDGLMALLSPG